MSQNDFLGLFTDSVFANLDEKKEQQPRHTLNLGEVLALNGGGGWGAYFSVNGFANFATNPQRKKHLVTSLNAHFIDIDGSQENVRQIANDAAVLAAEKGIPFTCIVTTGRGIHGYWVFTEPIVNPTEEQKREYERIQESLIRIFGADAQAKDIARIMRIPGSKYWKDGSGKEVQLGTITPNR